MATFYSNTSNTYRLRMEVTVQSQDIGNNTSSILTKLYIENGTKYMDQRVSAWMEVDGSRLGTISDTTMAIPSAQVANRSTLLFSKTTTVSHNSSGDKTISVKAYFKPEIVYSWSPQTALQINTTMALTSIPKGSTITTFNSFTINATTVTATVSRATSSHTHTFSLQVMNTAGNWVNVKTVADVGLTTDMALSTSQQNTVYNATPNSTTARIRLYVTTFYGSTQVGTTSKEVSGTIPSTVKPLVSNIEIRDLTISSSNLGHYIQNISRFEFTVSGSAGTGATITKYTVSSVSFPTLSSDNKTIIMLNPLNRSGSVKITGTITDSRGKTHSSTRTITLLAYSPPKINEFVAYRASDSAGTPDPFGTNVYVRWNVSISSVKVNSTSSELNTSGTRYIHQQILPDNTWNYKVGYTLSPPGGTGSQYFSSSTTDEYPTDQEYILRLRITDKFSSTYVTVPIPVGQVPFAIGRESIGAGKVPNDSYNLMVGKKGIHSEGEIYSEGGFYSEGETYSEGNLYAPSIGAGRTPSSSYNLSVGYKGIYSTGDLRAPDVITSGGSVEDRLAGMPRFITLTSGKVYGKGVNYIQARIEIPSAYRSNIAIIPNWQCNDQLFPYIAWQTYTSTFDINFYHRTGGNIGTNTWAEAKITIIY